MGFRIGNIDVLQFPTTSTTEPLANYNGLKPSVGELPAGFQKTARHRAFRANTIFEKDVAVPLRDGAIIRADVFRPADAAQKVPALVAWSPYGKNGTGRVGVAQDRLSGFESFEAPDPAEWTARGYAIVNVDSRGAFGSEGDVKWFGSAEGRDGYDAVEHLATLPWCSGKIALVGNSWLAAVQWFIAAEQPPHLTCIAPLEGLSDMYRETLCRGGVPFKPFWGFLSTMLFGHNKQEDAIGMVDKYPLMNDYWTDKRVDMKKINVPVYVLASYSTALHTVGSFRGFEEVPTKEKWLRVHATQEWHDLYSEECIEDLQRYFDYYLKGKQNGWNQTPHVRVSILRFNQDPILNHVFSDWPVPETEYRKFYMSQDSHLVHDLPSNSQTFPYRSDTRSLQIDADSEELHFSHTFTARSCLVGYSRAVLYVSCADSDDLDIFVQLRKADANGKLLQNINIPLEDLKLKAEEVVTVNINKYLGPTGILRASHRKIDVENSSPYWPLHSHLEEEKVPRGQVVEMTIGLWPTGMVFEAGEQLVLKIAGHHMCLAEFEPLRGGFDTSNKGTHVVHVGPEHPSHIVVPFVSI